MDDPAAIAWDALGTRTHILVTDSIALRDAEAAVRSILDRVDRTYSRFRTDSELVALNANAGRRVRVSSLLFDAIDVALRAAEWTAGASDPTIGHALRLLGYDRDFAALPADGPAPPLVIERVPGWRTVELDRAGRSIRAASGVELDLGSTGKALAADLAAAAAHAALGGRVGVLVNLGGDIATAGVPPEGGWPVRIGEDSRTDPSSDGEVVDLHTGALATSSTTVRRWTAGGVVRHHIVDPWTGRPANGPWRTVTIAARTSVDANAAATAAIVMGDRAVGWLEERRLPARLVGCDGTVLRIAGWPESLADVA